MKPNLRTMKVALLCTGVASALHAQVSNTVPGLLAGPYLQGVTRTGITVLWETEEPATTAVEYDVDREPATPGSTLASYGQKAALGQRVEVLGLRQMHEVALTNLAPRTSYLYRVRSRTEDGRELASGVFTFQTAVESDDPFTFGVISDTQHPPVTKKLTELLFAQRPQFCIHAGDLEGGGAGDMDREWRERLLNPAAALMQRVAVFTAIGNHDGEPTNLVHYLKYMANPEPEVYYTFTYGNAQFFVINSCRPVDASSEQYRWLERELERCTAVWRFVVQHHPPYSSELATYCETRGNRRVQALVGLYERYHVDIVFAGHSHQYERTWPLRAGKAVANGEGVIYLVIGGSGSWQEEFAPTRSWFTAQTRRGFFCGTVGINGRHLELRMLDEEGALFDLLTLDKP